jgi:hypothetical protein
MKEILLLICGILIGRQLMAQTFSEWFRQNHTQLRYLAEQIAALRGYDGVLQQGYAIAQRGLEDIDTIDEDDLSLHADHFAALDEASPGVKEDDAVAAINHYCALLPLVADTIAGWYQRWPASPLNLPEMGMSIAARIREVVVAGEEALTNVLADDELRMDDAGRLTMLNSICQNLRNLYGRSLRLLGELEGNTVNPVL